MKTTLLLAIAYLGFVSLGLPDTVAGVAWPSVRDTFQLSQNRFGLLFIALGCGYCASGFFGGRLTQALGVGQLLTISSGLVAIAMFGIAVSPVWPLVVACAVVWGLGSGAIDAGLNGYVASHFSARHVNWLHACYSLGATLGPLLMTLMLVQVGSWRSGYALVGGLVLGMTVLFLGTRRKWDEPTRTARDEAVPPVSIQVTLQDLRVWLQILAFFLYVGLEFMVGQWSFTLLTESRNVRADQAGVLTGSYFAVIGIGRVVFGAIVDRIGLDRLVRYSLLTAVVGTLLFTGGSSFVNNMGLVLIGIGLAPIFPCLMARTPQRLGAARAVHAIGFQVSAGMLGAALVPGIAGLAAESFGLEVVAQAAVLLAVLLFLTHEWLLNTMPSE